MPRHRPRAPRPRRHTPRTPPLPASLHERNTAPAGQPTAWLTPIVKEISPLLAQNGQNTALFGVPGRRIFHGTPPPFTQGRLFFHLNPPYPTGGIKLALLGSVSAQAVKNSPSTLKTPQNQRFFASRASFFSVSPKIHSCWASFFALMGATDTSQHPPTASPETDDTNAGGSLPQNETTGTSASSSPSTRKGVAGFIRRRIRSAGSQQGAQTPMLAAAAVALIASGQFDSKEMP